ncbi:MAG: hypothetical protein IJ189_14205 [Clostridia bacterium]|nr:hypothetical protein [Clostridia bacterium]
MGNSIVDLGRKAVDDAIEEWIIGRNGERDRLVIRLHLFDGPTLEEIQKRLQKYRPNDPSYDLSIDGIKKIIFKREEQLAKHLRF